MTSRRKTGAMKEGETAYVMPTELEEEILYRLPSNDLLRCKAVCKNWRRLISSRGFIQKHLERSISRCNETCFLNTDKRGSDILYLESKNIAKKIPLHNVETILGYCDGLVLCLLSGRRIAAVNPSAGGYAVRTPIPSISNEIEIRECSWFGRHPRTGEYILVLAGLFSTERPNIVFNEYSLACNNQYRILSSSSYPLSHAGSVSFVNMGTSLHGRLHCLFRIIGSRGHENVVLVHSFEAKAKIKKMWCPVKKKKNPTLGVVDGCLSAISVSSRAYKIWVMKEYGNDKSWTKLANIEGCRINCGNILSRIFPFDYKELSPEVTYRYRNKDIALFYGYKGTAFIHSLVSSNSVFEEKEKDGRIVD